MNQAFKNLLHLHFLVFIWGFTAVIGLKIETSAAILVLYRTLLAALGIGIVIVIRHRNKSVEMFKNIKPILGVGFIVGLHWLSFFYSGRYSNASVSLAGFSTCSLWTAILSPLFFKKSIRPIQLLVAGMVIVGLYIIFQFQFGYALGLALGILSGFCGALMSILNSKLTQQNDVTIMTFWEMLAAAACALVFIGLDAQFFGHPTTLFPPTHDWPWLLALGWACTVYPFTAANFLLRKISAFTFSLAVNLEPVYGIILAFLFLGKSESMTPSFYVGTGIILAAVLIYPFFEKE